MSSGGVTLGPAPRFDRDSAPFWEGCAAGELRVQRCARCDAMRFPPVEYCPACHSNSADWVKVPGAGRVQSFVVVHRAFDPRFADAVPYIVGMIQLDETAPPVVLPGLLRRTSINQASVGLRVRAEYEPRDNATALAVFVPEEEETR